MGAKRKNYDKAVELYDRGLSIQDVANFYGITRQAMWKILKRRNVDMRDNKRYKEDNHFYRNGASQDQRATAIYRNAIARGILVSPGLCESCGVRGKVVGHHDDYSSPLDVRWLCHSCHHEWHKHNTAKEAVGLPPPMDRKEIARLGGLASQRKKRESNG